MNERLLIDTDVLIDYLRSNSQAVDWEHLSFAKRLSVQFPILFPGAFFAVGTGKNHIPHSQKAGLLRSSQRYAILGFLQN